MKSLHTRLDPIRDEVLKCLRIDGYGGCYEKGYYRDYIAFHRWVQDATGGEGIGRDPAPGMGGVQGLLDHTLQTFITTVTRLKAENEDLKREVTYLRAQLAISNNAAVDRVLELESVCAGSK